MHGSHTASGKPLVVVEPHTAPGELTQYSFSQFEILGESLTGSTFLGVPGLVNGRTERASWGQTSAMQLNNVNLYYEILNDDMTHYLANGQWVPLEYVGGRMHTLNGPIIEHNGAYFSLEWSGAF